MKCFLPNSKDNVASHSSLCLPAIGSCFGTILGIIIPYYRYIYIYILKGIEMGSGNSVLGELTTVGEGAEVKTAMLKETPLGRVLSETDLAYFSTFFTIQTMAPHCNVSICLLSLSPFPYISVQPSNNPITIGGHGSRGAIGCW